MGTNTAEGTLRQTPLHAFHLEQGAKMVDFTGWSMPLHYGSILDEHRQVRSSGGCFDVTHMGRLVITGRDARRFLDRVCTRQIAGMKDGQARYSIVCNERGGCRDDVLVYRLGESEYWMVCNAANREKLLEHFDTVRGDLVFKLDDITEKSVMIAVQGPRVMEIIGRYSREIPEVKRYWFTRLNVLGLGAIVSRTGYTGEDGVEIMFRSDSFVASLALKTLMKDFSALEDVIRPAGLGARDSLRLEAAMALYGHEISEEIDPVSAGLDFAIKLAKGDDDPDIGRFIGQDALQAIAADGPRRRLVGLVLDSPRAARQEMAVQRDGTVIGAVTSGCVSPTLEKSIAMAYVDADHADEGTTVCVDLGRQTVDATIVPLPFYKRG
ncbi:MAG: glycine cleavage system aminomethyltransferase GcvT [Planctomycetes bacterium]|nr:glycine cleavage system aminomethyltransferase GcvT [Planctomycetota bacterium]